MPTAAKYWLVKTEPDSYSIHDLAREPNQTTSWGGVRNYQARNFLRDDMRVGERVLIYHSNADPPAVVGIGKIVREAHPDVTAWDEGSAYFDAKSSRDDPRWFAVDIQLDTIFSQPVDRATLQQLPALAEMELLRKGSRLSVQPVRKKEFDAIVKAAAKLAK